MLKKLRLKFVLINMSIVAAMLVVIFFTVYHFTKTDLDNQSHALLQSLSQNSQQPGSIRPQDVQLPYFVIQINVHGEVVASGHTYYDLKDQAFMQSLIQRVCTAQSSTGMIEEYALRYHRISLPGLQKLVFVDVSSQQAALNSLIQTSVLMGIISLVAFAGISVLLARWAVKPVERAWQQQRQFVSDASHELKTPLTVILSNAELLQGTKHDDGEREQFTENILTMTYRMRSLVEGLLELARADNGQVKNAFAPLDFSKLVSDALLPFEPMLFERGLTLNSAIEPGITLTGSAQHLQQVVDILLDNAGKYAAAGIVAVNLQKQGRAHCLLTVSNPGRPIAPEELERIFERFYREDKARAGNGSFGLGLSIARSIVQAHNGKIWAESNETGNCFFVQLPC